MRRTHPSVRRGKEIKPLIIRPYHIWRDVCSDRVLQKNDFKFYAIVRDILLAKQFKIDRSELVPGGNKGSVLAHLLGII